jgi:hypothetical protein
MPYAFANRRTIRAGSYERSTPWLRGVVLEELEKRQLLAVMQLFAPELTEAEMLAGDTRFFADRVQMFAETPCEWWDIVDDEVPRFQLWLCSADCGYLFAAGTTDLAAIVIQDQFDLDEQLPADARAGIAAAAKIAKKRSRTSRLADVDFEP